MLTTFFKSIGLVNAKPDERFYRHQINLSGSIFEFSMPENFSKDFPADDIVTDIDLNKSGIFSDFNNKVLMARFWDFEDSGFFGKNVGTVKLAISVNNIADISGRDITFPMEFVTVVIENLNNLFAARNKSKISGEKIIYSDSPELFIESSYNNINWIRYTYGTEDDRELTICYAAPLTDDKYIEMAFSLAPSDHVRMRGFIEEYTREFVNKIMETTRITNNNESFSNRLRKNGEKKLEEILREERQKMLLPEYKEE